MTASRGQVHWGPAPHKSSPAFRPWLVVSSPDHPFADEECIVVALTTTPHEQGIRIPDDAWTAGGSEKRAFASPWYVATIKHRTFDRHQGTLAPSFVDRVASALREYVPEQP